MNKKTEVCFYGEWVYLCDLAKEVGRSVSLVHNRHATIGRPEDITAHDDILAPKGKWREPLHVVVDGERMLVLAAADRFLTTKQTVMDRVRRFGLVLSSSQLRCQQGRRLDGRRGEHHARL